MITEVPVIPNLAILKPNLANPHKSSEIKEDDIPRSALQTPKCYKNVMWD